MSANLALLQRIVGKIEPLLSDVVFVGGAIVELYVTRPVSEKIRPTKDADVVVRVLTLSEYDRLGRQLKDLEFSQSAIHGDPPYRWRSEEDDILDVMPIRESVLGFSNRWYKPGVREAVTRDLEGLPIQLFPAPYYFASKLEAHRDRGRDDPYGSKDFGDAVVVLGNRPEIVDEIAQSEPELQDWIARAIRDLFPRDRAPEYLAAHLPVQRVPDLLDEVEARLDSLRNPGAL